MLPATPDLEKRLDAVLERAGLVHATGMPRAAAAR